MQAGEYEAATADFTAQMKGGLGVDKLAAVQAQLAAAGAETARGEPVVSEQSGMTVVVIRIHREHAHIAATIAAPRAGKGAALPYPPPADPPPAAPPAAPTPPPPQ